MVKIKEWSDEEVERLRRLYTSNIIFEEIIEKFPLRTGNAIRLKASRLSIKRPIIDNIVYDTTYDKLKNIEKHTDFLAKCNECGTWMQVARARTNTLTCEICGELYHL